MDGVWTGVEVDRGDDSRRGVADVREYAHDDVDDWGAVDVF